MQEADMNTLQKTMENWFTAVAYADAGQPGWTDDLWSIRGKRHSPALKQTLLYGAGSICIYVLAFANADVFAPCAPRVDCGRPCPLPRCCCSPTCTAILPEPSGICAALPASRSRAQTPQPNLRPATPARPLPGWTRLRWRTAKHICSAWPGRAAAGPKRIN